jgi:predicted transcriptional regulator
MLSYIAGMPRVPRDTSVTFRLPGDVRADLERIAEAQDRSMSWIVVQAVREYVQRELPAIKSPKSVKAQ